MKSPERQQLCSSNHAKIKNGTLIFKRKPKLALFKVNYRKSVTVRKIFKSSSKLDQAEYCKFFRFEMTSK